jgi:hypothetical protein
MHSFKYTISAILIGTFAITLPAQSQTKKAKKQQKEIKTETTEKESKGGDRNVMLNAESNDKPREINIGLPSNVGGTTILQNGLPVCFHFWPEMPTAAWRNDATISKGGLKNITETAIDDGAIGYAVNSYDNRGTDQFHVKGSFNSNHFGLINATATVSGPIAKGFKYVAGAFLNFDPGTFKADGWTKYYADNTKLFKVGLTKDYTWGTGKGELTFFYRYASTRGLLSYTAPYIYSEGGKVTEINGFKIGNDSYLENPCTMYIKDAYTGEISRRNPIDDYGTKSNAFELLWDHSLANGMKISWHTNYRSSHSGINSFVMSSVAAANNNYTYLDGKPYTGEYVQQAMYMATRKTPIKTLMSTLEVNKQSGKHNWTLGLNEWHYNAKNYTTEVSSYFMEVNESPAILLRTGSTASTTYDGMYGFNSFMEFHNGNQNKFAFIAKDKWAVSKKFNLDMGMRLEYSSLRGERIKAADRTNGMLDLSKKSPVKNDWFNKNAYISPLYRIAKGFGVQGDFMYAEQGGILGNYNTGIDKEIKQSKIKLASIGVYFNRPIINVVSKLSFINRTNYSGNTNFIHPTSGLVARTVVGYDVQTLGWTTDVILKPVKGFDLHFLLTLQSPQYKNYSGHLTFSDGTERDYDFDGETVTGMSKTLIEIDPSYSFGKQMQWRVWASARYFSKTYANLSNTLTFEGHWETFGGVSYRLNKNWNFNVGLTNILNQRGAKGTISGTDLMTADEAKARYGTVMSGTYILPFTVKFGVNFNF